MNKLFTRAFWQFSKVYCKNTFTNRGKVFCTRILWRNQRHLQAIGNQTQKIHERTYPIVVEYVPSSVVGIYLSTFGSFEEPLLGRAVDCLRRVRGHRPVFFDVGANYGIYSLAVACHVDAARVYSFEPVPKIHAILERNISLNEKVWKDRGSSIEPHRTAISSVDGQVSFELSGDDAHGSLVCASSNPSGTMSVAAVRGDNFLELAGIAEIDFCKVDVEAGEDLILSGFEQTLAKQRIRWLQIEIGNRKNSSDGKSVAERILKAGYRLIAGDSACLDKADQAEDFLFERLKAHD